MASAMRATELQSTGSIVKGMESFANERLGSCTVEHTELADGWKTYDPIRVSMNITAPNWIKNAGPEMQLIKLPWIGAHMAPTSVARKERKRDYLTGGPDQADYHLALRLPEGMGLQTIPAPREFRGAGYRAQTTVENGTDGIELRVRLATDDSRVAAADYPAFRQFVHDLSGFFEDQHVLHGA
jgi:hypothetical protein